MSLNYTEKDGRAICQVGKKIVYLHEEEGGDKEIKLTGKEEKFIPAIDKKTEREIYFVAGPSGSGKSFFTKQYIEVFHKTFPKRKVYMFSALEDDKTLDHLKYIKRIKIKDPEFLRADFTIKDFKDTLIIFDDVDAISTKSIVAQLTAIQDMIMNLGRHENVFFCYTSHLLYNGIKTKKILSECHKATIFPLTSSKKHVLYLLETYFGFSKEDIERLIKLRGRSKTICKSYPIVAWSENEVFIRD